jgi:hypothetical protein
MKWKYYEDRYINLKCNINRLCRSNSFNYYDIKEYLDPTIHKFTLQQLQNKEIQNINYVIAERYLHDDVFLKLFGMTKEEFLNTTPSIQIRMKIKYNICFFELTSNIIDNIKNNRYDDYHFIRPNSKFYYINNKIIEILQTTNIDKL